MEMKNVRSEVGKLVGAGDGDTICLKCRHFDMKAYEEFMKEWLDEIVAGAKACRSNGIATQRKVWCSHFEKR